MWTILKVFIECYHIASILCFGLFWPGGMWVLGSPTRDQTCTPSTGRQSLNHWTAREVPTLFISDSTLYTPFSSNHLFKEA